MKYRYYIEIVYRKSDKKVWFHNFENAIRAFNRMKLTDRIESINLYNTVLNYEERKTHDF